MAEQEEAIIAAGAQIIWILQEDPSFNPGTAASCRFVMEQEGSDQGLCVGDGQTMPNAGVFDSSPFTIDRGFDLIVTRSEMRIVFVSTHGQSSNNENQTGEELLAEIRRISAK